MGNEIDIKAIAPDLDVNKQCTLLNPLADNFEFFLDGKPFVIPSMGLLHCNEPVAKHGASHLAKRIVKENRVVELADLLDQVHDEDNIKYRKLVEKPYNQKDLELIERTVLIDGIKSFEEIKPIIEDAKKVKKTRKVVKK